MAATDDVAPRGLELVRRAAAAATAAERPDLVPGLRTAAARLRRPGTVLSVVGEFKQGKSSLVNALIGQDLCPVDDDLATSVVVVVHHANEPTAVVRRASDDPDAEPGTVIVEQVSLQDARPLVTETGNPDNVLRIERVDLGAPSPLLASGLTLVDTPGSGGLGGGHREATLAFLPHADGLLFVTDASQELTQPEMALLADAAARCPLVLCVLTKIDLHPHWRQIAERNRQHLDARGADVQIVPVSAALSLAGRHDDSGIATLLSVIDERVTRRAQAAATRRAAREVSAAVGQLRATADAERTVLRDPAAAAELQARVEAARATLAHLKGPAAAWRTVVADRTADLATTSTQDLRRMVRDLTRSLEERLDDLRSADDWERISRDLQHEVSVSVSTLFAGIETAGEELRLTLVDLLAQDEVHLPVAVADADLDVEGLWGTHDVAGGGSKVTEGLTAVRGLRSGLMVFGMLGRVLPAAAASLVASNPLTLGAGLLLGGKAVRDQRERRVAQQRQDARAAIRQFLDDVQFELGPKLQGAIRELQRQLRDGVTEQIAVLQATATDSGRQAKAALEASAEARVQRLAILDPLIADLDAMQAEAQRLLTDTDDTP